MTRPHEYSCHGFIVPTAVLNNFHNYDAHKQSLFFFALHTN
mgnify:CR=1 FL=1